MVISRHMNSYFNCKQIKPSSVQINPVACLKVIKFIVYLQNLYLNARQIYFGNLL